MNLILGDCLEKLKELPDNSVDSVITDPPYHLTSIVKRFGKEGSAPAQFGKDGAYARASAGFMGKTWDGGDIAFNPILWAEVFRVLKPGGHLLSFSATRTYHRMGVAIEDAGFEIRDQIMWVYGSGFPKSHDISKAMDKTAGRIGKSVIDLKNQLIDLVDRSGKSRKQIDAECGFRACNYLTLPADGKKFDPWVGILPTGEKWLRMKEVLGVGDDLDDAFAAAEREVVGMRRVVPGVAFSLDGPSEIPITLPATAEAKEWEGWGTALKPAHEPICVARKPLSEKTVAENVLKWGTGAVNIDGCRIETNPELDDSRLGGKGTWNTGKMAKNVYEGGYSGETVGSSSLGRWPANFIHDGSDEVVSLFPNTTSGKLIRENIKAKNKIYGDRPKNLTGEYETNSGSAARFFYTAKTSKSERNTGGVVNSHPTVKPKALMAYLCRLVTPPGGTVLDPFMGSGSTGLAALEEGFEFIGIEREKEYFEIAEKRIGSVLNKITKLQDEALPL